MGLEPLERFGADVRDRSRRLFEDTAEVKDAVRRVGRNMEWVEQQIGRLAPSRLIRRFSTSVAEFYLRSLERAWGESGSPLLAARALLVARHEGAPVPEWVFQEMEGQAEGLLAIAESPKRPRQAIADALGLSHHGAWEAYAEWCEQVALADAMTDLLETQEVHVDEAATEVAVSFGVSEDRAKRAYRDHRNGT